MSIQNRKIYPDQNYLCECFNYNEYSGELTWKKRPLKHFKNSHGMNTFNSHYSYKAVSCKDKDGYIVVRVNNKLLKAHRVCWIIKTGRNPLGVIDHINEITSDNSWENLQELSNRKNIIKNNSNKANTSGVTGVTFDKCNNKWTVNIEKDNKKYWLGRYTNFENAVGIRFVAEKLLGLHDIIGYSSTAEEYLKLRRLL